MRILHLRKKAKLTQQDVAEKLGIGRTTYLGYESGKITVPHNRLEILAELYGVTVDYLLGKSEHKTMFEEMDAKYDVHKIKREVIVREYVQQDLAGAMKIIFEEIERRRLF